MSISEVVKIKKRIRRVQAILIDAHHKKNRLRNHASGIPYFVLFFATRAYFAAFTSPRYFSIGSTFGALPSHASYIYARSSVFPRDRTIFRNRSPFARVSPP